MMKTMMQVKERELLEDLYYTASENDDNSERDLSDYQSDDSDSDYSFWEPKFGSAKVANRAW